MSTLFAESGPIWRRSAASNGLAWYYSAIIGFLVRLPALQGEMVWDDSYLVRDNPFIKSPLLILEAFRHHLFLDSYSAHYRPVQNLSFIVDYFFWNGNLYGFHLTNLILHIASGLLLYLFLGKLFPSYRAAETDNGRQIDLVHRCLFCRALMDRASGAQRSG